VGGVGELYNSKVTLNVCAQGLKIPMTYVLENKPRVTFLVIGDSLVLWKINTNKKNYVP